MKNQESAFGPWLAMVINERRVSTGLLAKKSGVTESIINDLISGKVSPEEKRDEVNKIAELILTNHPKKQLDLVLKALRTHVDLRNWKNSCDAGCCKWNTAIELSETVLPQ